jgi:hypothetical protein
VRDNESAEYLADNLTLMFDEDEPKQEFWYICVNDIPRRFYGMHCPEHETIIEVMFKSLLGLSSDMNYSR